MKNSLFILKAYILQSGSINAEGRGFLKKVKKHLISTPTGRALIAMLPAPIKDPATTALWEQGLDDIAQDIESLQLPDEIWQTVEEAAVAAGASLELSDRLRRAVCSYCNTANPVGESACIACGAPLGDVQPRTCLNCGFVVRTGETTCPNCGKPIR